MKIIYLGEYDSSEVTAAPIKVGKELFNYFSNLGLEVFYLPYFQDGRIFSRYQKLFGYKQEQDAVIRIGIIPLISFVFKFRPQIIHIITPALYYIILFPLKVFLRFKVISTLHSINRYVIPHLSDIRGYQKFRFLLIEKVVVNFSDLILVYSNRDKRYISKYYKVTQSKITVINNGIKIIDIRKDEFSINYPLKVVFVGNINRKEKGFNLLLNTLSKLDIPVFLSVFCNNKQNEFAQRSIRNVELVVNDPIKEQELRNKIIENDLFIVPSNYDSFSISLLEAMNTGIMVLASDRVGLIERFPSELNTLIVKNPNPDSLSKKIIDIIKLDKKDRKILSEKIRSFSLQFSWGKIANDYLEIYKKVSE